MRIRKFMRKSPSSIIIKNNRMYTNDKGLIKAIRSFKIIDAKVIKAPALHAKFTISYKL